MPIKLKPQYNDVLIGFNNSSLPLGQRNDLHKLYEVAKGKKHKAHLDMFEEVPDQAELDAVKEKAFNKKQDIKKLKSHSNGKGSKVDVQL